MTPDAIHRLGHEHKLCHLNRLVAFDADAKTGSIYALEGNLAFM